MVDASQDLVAIMTLSGRLRDTIAKSDLSQDDKLKSLEYVAKLEATSLKLMEVLEMTRRRALWPHEADRIRKELGL